MNSYTKSTCIQCKVYFGSPERDGMCSVCYKDFKLKSEKIQEPKLNEITEDKSLETPLNSEDKINETTNTNIRPIQTNPQSCWICNKKIGYLGFKCKCEYIFCGTHRHFSDHNCDFDYKSYDRQKLTKQNGLLNSSDNKMIK